MSTVELPGAEEVARDRFRENVVWLAEHAGLSIRRASGMADVSEGAVRSWLAGEKDPTLGNMARVADALGVDLSDLLLDPQELQDKIAEVGLRPFVLRRPDLSKAVSGSGSKRSAAAAAKRRGKIGAKGPLLHTLPDLRRRDPVRPASPRPRRSTLTAFA